MGGRLPAPPPVRLGLIGRIGRIGLLVPLGRGRPRRVRLGHRERAVLRVEIVRRIEATERTRARLVARPAPVPGHHLAGPRPGLHLRVRVLPPVPRADVPRAPSLELGRPFLRRLSRNGAPSRGGSSRDSTRAPRSTGARPPYSRPGDDEPLPSQAKKWGNVARRGAREVTARQPDGDQRTARFSDDQERRRTAPPPKPTPWSRVDGSLDEWQDTPARGKTRGRQQPATAPPLNGVDRAARASGTALSTLSTRKALPPEIAAEIRNAADVATALHRERLVEKAESAYGAYERGRYQDALRAIKPVADETPSVAQSGSWPGWPPTAQASGARRSNTCRRMPR